MQKRSKTGPYFSLAITRTMVWALLIGYSLFLVGRSTYQNFDMNREIAAQKERINELERKKRNLQLSLIYYKSNSFKEIEARRRLNLKGKDERVVALPDAKTEPQLAVSVASIRTAGQPDVPPPYIAWWRLFFAK